MLLAKDIWINFRETIFPVRLDQCFTSVIFASYATCYICANKWMTRKNLKSSFLYHPWLWWPKISEIIETFIVIYANSGKPMNLEKSDDLFLNIKNIFFYSILPVTSFQLSLPLMCKGNTIFHWWYSRIFFHAWFWW